MLQQTQVAVVIPYFERWMELFPSIAELARAPLDAVIKAWEGLGYYSRARHLHQAANQIIQEFGGLIPQCENALNSIKGLGPYTIGAIRAFAFKQKAIAVDGNTIRVLSRYFLIEEDLSKPKAMAQLRQRGCELLPNHEPWVITEALIELGATVCTRNPKCSHCPLQANCMAHRRGVEHTLPNRGKRAVIQSLFRMVALVFSKNQVLIRRCPSRELMSDLHEFPFLDTPKQGMVPEEFQRHFAQTLGIALNIVQTLPQVKHAFTRYRATLSPVIFNAPTPLAIPGYFWVSLPELPDLAFSSGHRQLMHAFIRAML